MMRPLGLVLVVLALAAGNAVPARAYCIPFPCDDCTLRSTGQITLVSLDRARGQVVMVPNIRIQGLADDFALVVPTPSLPALGPASPHLWDQAFDLTAGVRMAGAGGDLGCSQDVATPEVQGSDDAVGDGGDGDVVVHGRQTVGAMEAVILSSETPDALASWLRDNGFPFTEADAARFAPYVERDWFFTAMRPVDSGAMRTWDNNVDPVAFTFAADAFEVPMPVLGGPRTNAMGMAFFIVDDARADLDGFLTVYANRITASELAAIRDRHPSLAAWLEEDRVFTRLDRTLTPDDDYSRGILLARAEDQAEVRRVNGTPQRSAIPGFLVVTGALAWLVARRTGRRDRGAHPGTGETARHEHRGR